MKAQTYVKRRLFSVLLIAVVPTLGVVAGVLRDEPPSNVADTSAPACDDSESLKATSVNAMREAPSSSDSICE